MSEQKVDESKLKQASAESKKVQKFTDEELGRVKEVQKTYLNIQADLGQLSVAKLRLQQQLAALGDAEKLLTEKFTETNKTENELIDEITAKYGIGTLDPESGTFTPQSVKQQQQDKGINSAMHSDYIQKPPTSPISDAVDNAVKEGKLTEK